MAGVELRVGDAAEAADEFDGDREWFGAVWLEIWLFDCSDASDCAGGIWGWEFGEIFGEAADGPIEALASCCWVGGFEYFLIASSQHLQSNSDSVRKIHWVGVEEKIELDGIKISKAQGWIWGK